MYFSLAAVFLPLLAGLLASGAINIQAFLNPKLLYQTPGLWEKTAADFWRAFLFETPFAVLRGLGLPGVSGNGCFFPVLCHSCRYHLQEKCQ